ncbi:MAG: hypothetical protein Q9227_008862 [Pyrenula ochraceoflavens]
MEQDDNDTTRPLDSPVASVKSETSKSDGPARVSMERSFSQDIQEGSRELKEAAEQSRNIILDLSLDGKIRWVSPSWTDVVGTRLEVVKDRPIAEFIADDPDAFVKAVDSLKNDDSRSQFVKFAVLIPHPSVLEPMLGDEQRQREHGEQDAPKEHLLQLEGQGIMVYDRSSGGESHTMWMLQPPAESTPVTIALPQLLVDSLGVGAEMLANYLNNLTEVGASDPANHPPPMPVLCRICERQITPWWFEKHSDLCVQEHRAEMDVSNAQDHLAEHRHSIVKILDGLESRQSQLLLCEKPVNIPVVDYRGLPIGNASPSSSNPSSSSASGSGTPVRSRSPSNLGPSHSRGRSFAIRRPHARIVELILDLCDTALEINTPAIKETKDNSGDDLRTQSPQSESRISQVLQWQTPSSSTLEHEQGLAALSADTEKVARAKVEAALRHRRIIEYSERIRQEFSIAVDECISEAMRKAEKIAAGEPISSSEDEQSSNEEAGDEEDTTEEPTPLALNKEASNASSYLAFPAMASALGAVSDERQIPSSAVSTGSSSPMECPTPRSHKSTLLNHVQSKRHSILAESDANDSDCSGSLPSTISGAWRTESPLSDQGLSRAASTRDRKRRSLVLSNMGTGSPHRQQSPARYPQAPPSPLRMSKPRLPSGESAPSPVTSPLLTTGEFMSSSFQGQPHHRRQSSVHSSDTRPPSSPKLGASISHPQPKAVPPSIKDFEIIKPISKGAFGSVYLSKKKATGEYFAIKVLKKADMVAKNQVTNVKAERAIMMWQGESDFVAKLYWTFSSKDYLYLVMEYLNGGDCASLVKILGGLPEDWAKKYIAEVVLGVQHLHHRGIVHRDLKPDNLLIDQKGHLKLTDFGLSRMGLVGRQDRAQKAPSESVPDLLKQGPFTRSTSTASSRSASFDFHGHASPNSTPILTPSLAGGQDHLSYFSLSRDSTAGKDAISRTSGHRSESGSISSENFQHSLRNLSLHDLVDAPRSHGTLDDESGQDTPSPDLLPLTQSTSRASMAPQSNSPHQPSMLPPPMALFDPEDSNRRFVGTPDYLAPETINGTGQDEMSDWWSLGCILFEFLYGGPPFNADTPEQVFENILARNITWPMDSDLNISSQAQDLVERLIRLDPKQRLGANLEAKFPSGGDEIRNHPWFMDINWDTLLEDEAQFVPNPENPEDTEYFDARGATLQSFPEELEEQLSPPTTTPGGSEIVERPHDALLRVRSQVNSVKRGLMPLHIPPHVARDSRSRRLSEPVVADDFGNFTFRNLPVLEKANKDIVNKMRAEAMQAQAKSGSHITSPSVGSPAPSLEGSPLPMPLKRTMSANKANRPASPSGLNAASASPSRPSNPSSPLLVQFSTGQNHERRKTSAGSSSSSSLQPGSFFEIPKDAGTKNSSTASSPIKTMKIPAASPVRTTGRHSSSASRARSQTVGSQEGDISKEAFIPGHHKRRSQLYDISPSSSDTESAQNKAFLKVQRRRQSSRRLSQIAMTDSPMYRPLDVLICEDHPVSKMVLERLFEKLKCRTITASNGPEALRLAVSQIQFDIILMEFKLPSINGADVARMIRDTKNANTSTPLIAVTGYLNQLPESHHFDTLIQKPPTLNKLTETLCKYCNWKPPPKDYKASQPLSIPSGVIRQEMVKAEDSPSSTSSSLAPTMPDLSYRGSSREDSIGSSFFGDMENVKHDDVPVIISRQVTEDWSGNGGLGISEDIVTDKKPYVHTGFPHLVHTESAPPTSDVNPSTHKKHSTEAIRARKYALEKKTLDGGAESGDDEDEELGERRVRTRSPLARTQRTASRLGHEMMRTNSRGSVISTSDDTIVNKDELSEGRCSVDLLERRMEELKIPEEPDISSLAPVQPRKDPSTPPESQHFRPRLEARSDSFSAGGHITPPVIFPMKPGAEIKDVDMEKTVSSQEAAETEQHSTSMPPTPPSTTS